MAKENYIPQNQNPILDEIPNELDANAVKEEVNKILEGQQAIKSQRENTNHLIQLEKQASAMDNNEQFAMAKHFCVEVLADAIKWISMNREQSLIGIQENIRHLDDVLKGRIEG